MNSTDNWLDLRTREEIKVTTIVYLATFMIIMIAILAVTSIFNFTAGEKRIMIISAVSTLLIMYIMRFIQIKFG